jgi:predicted NBD/HSP70 family sugar kinase
LRDYNAAQRERVLQGETEAASSVYQAVYQKDPQTAELLERWAELNAAARAEVLAMMQANL